MVTDDIKFWGLGRLLRWVWDSKERLRCSLDSEEGVFYVASGVMEWNGHSCVSEGGEDRGAGGWGGLPVACQSRLSSPFSPLPLLHSLSGSLGISTGLSGPQL